MSDPFNFNEFISEKKIEKEEDEIDDLEVQKAVVEELAADKVKMEIDLEEITTTCDALKKEVDELKKTSEEKEHRTSELEKELVKLRQENEKLNQLNETLKGQILKKEDEIAALQTKEFDLQERNPNALALLDREVELPDRFPGETRDHVLEVIKDARDQAEKDGRQRRAQLLEGVLVANEPNGGLAKRRKGLEKFFNDNGNILSGPVIEELQKCGISHKEGETYLLPAEILKRTY